MNNTSTPTVSSFRTSTSEIRIAGTAKYVATLTLLVGVAFVAYVGKFLSNSLSLIAIGTGLTGLLAFLVHDQERPHRTTGLPKYTTVAAITGASILYYVVGWLAGLAFVPLGAALTWLMLVFGYVVMTAKEGRPASLSTAQATWLTGLLGLGLVAFAWIQRDLATASIALVVTGFAAFPQYFHLGSDSA